MPAIKYKKKTYAGATFPVLEMTKAQYEVLPTAKKMDGTVYLITDDTGGWEAENSAYDNTTSGMTATNVQDALDELNSKYVTTPTTDQLKAANVLVVYWSTADNSSLCCTTVRKSGNTTVSTEIWNGTRWYKTVGAIKWSKENGTLSAETGYSERGTTIVIDGVSLII